jgi:putative addiction module component (TIGR02574 family)
MKMSTTIDIATIRRLSIEERFELMDRIWDTLIDDGAEDPLSPEVLAEMRRRADELRKNPGIGISHEEMLRRLRSLK